MVPLVQGPSTVLCLTSGGCALRGGGQGDWSMLWSRAAFWGWLQGGPRRCVWAVQLRLGAW